MRIVGLCIGNIYDTQISEDLWHYWPLFGYLMEAVSGACLGGYPRREGLPGTAEEKFSLPVLGT